jgi:hypothetical protein
MSAETPTPTRGVLLHLDKERRLRFSLKTMRELREEFGENTLATGLSQDSIAKFLWHGLKHEDPELTIEQVEEIVDLEQLDEILDAVATATGKRGRLEEVKTAVAAVSDQPAPVSEEAVVAEVMTKDPPAPASEEPVSAAVVAEEATGAGPDEVAEPVPTPS